MIVVDAHEDIAYNALCFGRDYRHSAWETRRREQGTELINGRATVGLPDALLGRVALVFSTLFVAPRRKDSDASPWNRVTYSNPGEAYRLAGQQLDYYNRLADETDKVRLVRTVADLDAVLETWKDDKDVNDHCQGLVILMENADPIIEPQQFAEWYERGVRLVGPAWQETRYAGGTGHPGPLTKLGYELLDVMADYNAILDLSHLAEKACFEALDYYPGPIIASHSNPRYFRNSDRHLPDAAIRQLAERDGVMGIVLYNSFLSDEWTSTSHKSQVPLSRVLDVVDYICQLTGSAAHVALGSDFDGGFGADSIPDGLETVTDLWHIGGALRGRGYSEDDIAAILGGNMLRKLRQSLPRG
ncbi:MAG: membrane dipeptidase [Anaerolineaceae bacterium]|nr:membrane dipeptidase [Anaerolineaceae bacterium]